MSILDRRVRKSIDIERKVKLGTSRIVNERAAENKQGAGRTEWSNSRRPSRGGLRTPRQYETRATRGGSDEWEDVYGKEIKLPAEESGSWTPYQLVN